MNANLQVTVCRTVPTVQEATAVRVTSFSNRILLTLEIAYVSLIFDAIIFVNYLGEFCGNISFFFSKKTDVVMFCCGKQYLAS